MTASHDGRLLARRHRPDARTMAAISPLPPPEEVFIDWLLSVPHEADLEAAARREIALIDRRACPHPDILTLRLLLLSVAGPGNRPTPASRP